MCIIVYKPEGREVDRATLKTCFKNNPDGAGFMFPCEDRLLIRKGYFTFDTFWEAWEKTHKVHGPGLPVVFHFRIATAGHVDKRNCHPHRIAPDLGFVHNGILSCVTVPKHSDVSDTIIYRNHFLRDMNGRTLRKTRVFERMSGHIGKHNKFVFMNGKGKVQMCNEAQGEWEGGLWYSNLTFLARAYSYYYDDVEFEADVCDYCGKDLDSPVEREDGLCFDCLYHYAVDEPQQCGGCRTFLPSYAHREAGWCDECGYEIYGKEWPRMLEINTERALSRMQGEDHDRQYNH